MAQQTLLVKKADGVGIITLHRPQKLNAVNLKMRGGFLHVLENFSRDNEVEVVIVTGAGRAFCTGADINELGKKIPKSDEKLVRVNYAVRKIYEFEKPVIGAINGICAGEGAQWMLAFDLNIAADTAKFAWPATSLGILCPYGIIRLPAEVGRFRAKELLMTSKYLNAEEAHAWGLINHVVPAEKVMDTAMGLANDIKKMPPLSIKAIKEAVNRGMEGYEYAGQVLANLLRTEDAKEGMKAFIEKRKPRFQGR